MRLRLNNPSPGYNNPERSFQRVTKGMDRFIMENQPDFPAYFLALYEKLERGLQVAYRQKDQRAREFHEQRIQCGRAICLSCLHPGEDLRIQIGEHLIHYKGMREIEWWGRGFWDAYLLQDHDAMTEFAVWCRNRIEEGNEYPPEQAYGKAFLYYQLALFEAKKDRVSLAQKVVNTCTLEGTGEKMKDLNFLEKLYAANCRLAIEKEDAEGYNDWLGKLIELIIRDYVENPDRGEFSFNHYQEQINCLALQGKLAGMGMDFESDLVFDLG